MRLTKPGRGAMAVVVIGVMTLAACASGIGAPRGWIASRYQRNGTVFVSNEPAAVVAGAIARARAPRARDNTASGTFLRYDTDIVGVFPSGLGSRIEVEDYDRGYRRWNPYVGGRWPRPGRGGGWFRGGGSGFGGK